MKKIRIIGIIISVFFISTVCKAETSSFKPDWYIGDTWKMEFARRSTGEFSAAMMFIGGPQLGDFSTPSICIFTVTGKKEIKGEECFEVEMSEQYPDKEVLIMRLYYTIDGLKIRLVEKVLEDGSRIPYYSKKDGPVLEPYSTSKLPLSWPDFTQLDPANSPQVFPWSNSKIQQVVEVNEDILKVTWRLFYNETDDTWKSFVAQEWKRGDPWWYKYEMGDESIITRKAHTTFIELIPAAVDIDPNTINLKSKGTYITAYIELPSEYEVNHIDVATVTIKSDTSSVSAETTPTKVGDFDSDGIPDLMVKFDRSSVHQMLSLGNVGLTVKGSLTGGLYYFEGTGLVNVIDKGKDHIDETDTSSVVY